MRKMEASAWLTTELWCGNIERNYATMSVGHWHNHDGTRAVLHTSRIGGGESSSLSPKIPPKCASEWWNAMTIITIPVKPHPRRSVINVSVTEESVCDAAVPDLIFVGPEHILSWRPKLPNFRKIKNIDDRRSIKRSPVVIYFEKNLTSKKVTFYFPKLSSRPNFSFLTSKISDKHKNVL